MPKDNKLASAKKKATTPTFEDLRPKAIKAIYNAILDPSPETAVDEDISSHYYLSTKKIPGYSTLDSQHLKDIEALVSSI